MPGLAQLARSAGARPVLIVGGGVALLLLARLASSRTASDELPPDVPMDDESAVAADDGSGLDLGAGYGSPLAGYTVDPFALDYGPADTTGTTTPDGCPLPKPAIPTTDGYAGNGDWVCDAAARAWVWKWKASPKGCPLPKPTVPAPLMATHEYRCNDQTDRWDLVSKLAPGGCKLAEKPAAPPAGKRVGSGEWVCESSAWKWKPKAGAGDPPPSAGSGRITIPAGNHRTWAVDRTAKRAHDPKPWKLTERVTRRTGPLVRGIGFPAGSGPSPSIVVRLADGAHKGRWVRVAIGSWKADD